MSGATSAHTHDHTHVGHGHGAGATRRRLAIALALVLSYMIAEVVGGLLTGSLARTTDQILVSAHSMWA